VGDAVAVVAALAGQLDLTAGVTVELGPEGDEFAHPLGALGDQGPNRLDVAQADPGDQGVVEVLLRVSSGSSTAAMPPWAHWVEPAESTVLVTSSTRSTCSRSRRAHGQAGDAGADDDDVGGRGPAPVRGR
jgi:hypothetical protein